MKKIAILLITIALNINVNAQTKTIASTYKISFLKLDNGILLTHKNKDSIILIKIADTHNGIKNGGEQVTKQDSVEIENTNKSFINNILSLTLILKPDGKYNKLINTSLKNKLESLETGTYFYNSKTNLIKFKPKIKDEKNQNQIVRYNAIKKTISILADENEADAGEIIIQFNKIK